MSMCIINRSFGTHSGSFHADDVTACALLLYFEFIDKDKIIRTRDPNKLATCDFVCDVGLEYDTSRRRFDHHQADYDGDLSSAGMIVKYLVDNKIISDGLYIYLNSILIYGIDQIDNGRWEPKFGYCSFSQIISYFIPVSYQSTQDQYDDAFIEAVEFTYNILTKMILKFNYVQQCKSIVKDLMDEMNECLIFDKPMPWIEAFFELGGESHSAEFVIMPSDKHWKLRGIPPSTDKRMEVRRPLPNEWAGLSNEDLQRVSGIAGSIFCHKRGFVSIWKTREDALKALKMILAKKK